MDLEDSVHTENILKMLEAHHIPVVIANCTDRLQPLNVSVKKAAKESFHSQFQEWYSEKICQQLQVGTSSAVQPVDLRMSIMKPLGAGWMISLYDHMIILHTINYSEPDESIRINMNLVLYVYLWGNSVIDPSSKHFLRFSRILPCCTLKGSKPKVRAVAIAAANNPQLFVSILLACFSYFDRRSAISLK